MICLKTQVSNRPLFNNSSRIINKMMMTLGSLMILKKPNQGLKKYKPSRQNLSEKKKSPKNQMTLKISITYLILLHLTKLRKINRRSSNLSTIIIRLICSRYNNRIIRRTNITLLIKINHKLCIKQIIPTAINNSKSL